MRLAATSILITIVTCNIGCAPKSIRASQLSSSLRSLESYASEVELLIEYIQAGKATEQYERGHLLYLADQVRDASQELDAPAGPGLDLPLATSRQQYQLLQDQILLVSVNFGDPVALASIQENLKSIQEASDRARRRL